MKPGVHAEAWRCSTCGGPIGAQDVDRSLGVATCPHCTTVTELRGRASVAVPPSRGELVPLPERFLVSEEPGALRIQWRWFRPSALFLVGFCVFWDGFLVVWYAGAFASGSTVMALFPLLHVAAGVTISYVTLATLLNRTVVEARPRELSIVHGPIPWKGALLLREDVAQLYVEENVSRGKNGTTVTWGLSAVLRSGKRQKLLTGLEEKAQALYLERALEARFGIVDQPVTGETK